ncbi:FAS1-like dehydratase domain-containing protein [Nocardia rhamnosiphila]
MTGWEPHTVITEEYLDPAPVAALQALLDTREKPVGTGDPLPPLWHWVALPRWPESGSIGADGHPVRGGFLPPVDLPRRMFAGGDVRFGGDLTIGSTVRREARVVSVTPKAGRSGRLVVVVVEIRLSADSGSPAVVERQDLIYRAPGPGTAQPPAPASVDPAAPPLHRVHDGEWELRTDPTLLMRFSAATANAHRIHYDWPYATGVEGYPGLVVHGPLMTLALAETIRLDKSDTGPARLRHRNLAPLFCPGSARIGRHADSDADLAVALTSPADPAGDLRTHTILHADFPALGD